MRSSQQYKVLKEKRYKGKRRKSKKNTKYTYTYKIVDNKEIHI